MTLQQLDTIPPQSVYVLGVRVDRISQQQALDAMEQMIANHRANMGAELSRSICQQIITVNPEFVMAAQHNDAFREAINSAALVLADGTGVVWATRYLGKPAPERVTGIDTLPLLAQRCAAHGYRMYLLGAARRYRGDSGGATCKNWRRDWKLPEHMPVRPLSEEEDAIIERVRAARGGCAMCGLWRTGTGPVDTAQPLALACRYRYRCWRRV